MASGPLRTQEASQWADVSHARAKSKMFDRMAKTHMTSLRNGAIEDATQRYQEEIAKAAVAETPRQCKAQKRPLHELTHIPYLFGVNIVWLLGSMVTIMPRC